MKRLLLLAIIAIASFSNAGAQTLPETTTKITKGARNSFFINEMEYPLNSVIFNIRSYDTSMIQLEHVFANGLNPVIAPYKKRVKYINGTTGQPFPNITRFRGYVDSFCFSH